MKRLPQIAGKALIWGVALVVSVWLGWNVFPRVMTAIMSPFSNTHMEQPIAQAPLGDVMLVAALLMFLNRILK